MLEVMDRFASLDLLSDGRLSRGLGALWLDVLADSQILDLTPLQHQRCDGFTSRPHRLAGRKHPKYTFRGFI